MNTVENVNPGTLLRRYFTNLRKFKQALVQYRRAVSDLHFNETLIKSLKKSLSEYPKDTEYPKESDMALRILREIQTDKSSNMKKTDISQPIYDPGVTVNLYSLERLRRQQHIVMTNHRLNYENLLKEAREKDIMVLSLTPFCNKWYKDDIQPHSGKQRHIMQLKDDAINRLQNAMKNRTTLYTNLIPQHKSIYKRSMVHYQRLVSMINQMERILIDELYERYKTSQQYDESEIRGTNMLYKVISGEWGSKTGWHAELIWTSPSGQTFTVTV